MKILCLLFLISFYASSVYPQDQLVIENAGKDGKANHDADILIQAPMIRFEQQKRSMLFNADNKTVYSLDHKKKEYIELDKEQMKSMTSTVSTGMEMFRKQLEKMPPEQRAKWEAKLSKGPFAGAAETTKRFEYKEVKTGVPCGKWSCKLIEGTTDGVKTTEILLADYKALGLTEKSIGALKSMGQYFSEMAKMIGAQGPQFKFDQFEGIPVEVKTFDKEGLKRTMVITEVKKFTPAKETFSVPKNYEKTKLPLL